jgi:enoyl-CoA hydratase/carnithine racemase
MTGVHLSMVGRIGVIELAEPHSRNALSPSLRNGLLAALREIADAPAVVITGQGPAFSAGGDLKAMPSDEASGYAFIQEIVRWFESVETCPVPTIAAVNGAAMGGGLELALACDLVVAAEHARFGLPETGVGLVAPYAAARLRGILPIAIAKELALTGRILTAAEAASLGLVNRVVPVDALLETALQLAEAIARSGELACRVTKELHNARPVTADQAARAIMPLFGSAETQSRIRGFPRARD